MEPRLNIYFYDSHCMAYTYQNKTFVLLAPCHKPIYRL